MLTTLDMIVLILVGGAAVLGAWRGFVTEVLSLLAWGAAVVALKFLHAPVTGLLTGVVGTVGAAAVLAFVLVFLVTFLVAKMAAVAIGNRTRSSVLGPLDRMLGLGFGAVKGLLAATLLFLVANLGYDTVYGTASSRPDWMTQSRSYRLLSASSRAVVDWVDRRRHAPPAAADAPAGNDSDAG